MLLSSTKRLGGYRGVFPNLCWLEQEGGGESPLPPYSYTKEYSMAGIKNRKGHSSHRYWVDSSTGVRLTRVMVVTNGKKRMVWKIKKGDEYTSIPESNCVLR